MRKVKIKDIAEVKSGLLLAKAVNRYQAGNTYVITTKDVDEYGFLQKDSVVRIDVGKNIKDELLLNSNDVLITAKSSSFTATAFNIDFYPAVASSNFLSIRIKSEEIIPEYLAWCLNQSCAQKYFEKTAIGSRLKIINKGILEKLKIPLPEKDVQNKIIKIHKLQVREKEIRMQILEKKDLLTNSKLLKLINK